METNLSQPEFENKVRGVALPPELSELAAEYDAQIGIRDEYLWKWMAQLLPSFQLPCVPAEHVDAANRQKLLLTMYITTVDDIVEYSGDKETFEEARKIPFPYRTVDSSSSFVDSKTLVFAARVWKRLEKQLTDAPRYDEFEDIFHFDIRQALNAMEYSLLVSRYPAIANETGTDHYDSHNMVMFGYSDIDLMYAPDFDLDDLSTLRSTLWKTQRLARIGNWLTTWERELHEGDYSSGVVVTAIKEGIIDVNELAEGLSSSEISTITDRVKESEIEERLYNEWDRTYTRLLETAFETESIDLNEFIRGMETVFEYHINSKGSK